MSTLRDSHIRNVMRWMRRFEVTSEIMDRVAARNERAQALSYEENQRPTWRSAEDVERQARLKKYQDLFFSEHEKHLKPDWLKEGRALYKTYNWCRFITNTFADIIVGGGADILVGDKVIDDYLRDELELPIQFYKWIQMTSIFGFIALQVVEDNEGVDLIEVDPWLVYPEFKDSSGYDYKHISKKFIVRPEQVVDPSMRWQWFDRDRTQGHQIVFEERHFRGIIEYYLYVVEGNDIIETLPPAWYDPYLPEIDIESGLCLVETDIDDFMLMVVPNVLLMKKFVSDYDDLVTLQESYNTRGTQIGRILNIHADPKLLLPDTMKEIDPLTGRVIHRGLRDEILYISSEDNTQAKPEYLTWNAQISEARDEMRSDRNAMLTLSYVSDSFIVSEDNPTFPESALAYKMRLTPTLNRAKVKAADFKKYMQRLLYVLIKVLNKHGSFDVPSDEGATVPVDAVGAGAEQENPENPQFDMKPDTAPEQVVPEQAAIDATFDIETLKPKDITLKFKPSLPQDERFLTERVGTGVQTVSRERLLKDVDGFSDEEIMEELKRIDEDSNAMNESVAGGSGLRFGEPFEDDMGMPKENIPGQEEINTGGVNIPENATRPVTEV